MRAKVISNKSSANFLRVTISTLMLLVAVSLRQHPLTDLLFEIFYILVTLNFLVTLPYLIFISQQLTDFTKYGVLFASFLFLGYSLIYGLVPLLVNMGFVIAGYFFFRKRFTKIKTPIELSEKHSVLIFVFRNYAAFALKYYLPLIAGYLVLLLCCFKNIVNN